MTGIEVGMWQVRYPVFLARLKFEGEQKGQWTCAIRATANQPIDSADTELELNRVSRG